MQYDENAEKYGYEGEMTPIECDELKAYKGDVTIPVYGTIADAEVYLKKDVDKTLAEKDKEITKLKDKCQMHNFFWVGCGFAKRGFKNTIAVSEAFDKLEAENAELKKKLMPCLNGDCILTCEVVEKYGKENAELKQKLESVQASMYADVVDANMENRRLKRALWLERARNADSMYRIFYFVPSSYLGEPLNIFGYSNEERGRKRMLTADKWKKIWLKVLRKCLKKAEEYK